MALTPAIIKATITQGLATWNEATSNEPTDIEGTIYRITDATITMAYEWRRLSARATDANEASGYLTHCLGWAATALEVDGLWHATTLTDLLVRKSTLYGTSNHELYGILGIMVRISDKVSRMHSLIKHRHASPEAEYRWRDTLYDIAGYAVLGLLLLEKGSNEG